MTRKSVWSPALPFVIASCIYLVGVVIAVSLPAGKKSSKPVDEEAHLLSPRGEPAPSHFKTEPETEDEIGGDDAMAVAGRTVLHVDDDYRKSHGATVAATSPCKPQRKRGFSCKFGTIVVLQFLTEAAFGIMNPILSIIMTEEQVLQIAACIFVIRVFWAVCILPETVPKHSRMTKTHWVMESPISSLSILFRNKLFMRLTCLIVITSFIRNGIFQIQSFFLNTIVGFDVKDFANLMLLGGVLALLGQGLLVKALVGCFKEKGVIIIALIASLMKTGGFAGAAFYPHKWVVFLSFIPGCIGDLTFPAISALKSMNVSEKEQGRLQGAIYGARSVFDAIGPIVFSSLYAAMTRQSLLSEALPYIVASCVYVVGIAVA
ncbi:hypothetical protein PHYSODRAFT_327017, partial [Phytophthora sojae]